MKAKRILSFLFAALIAVSLSGNALAADFVDVPATHKYKEEIDFCRAAGFVQGINSTEFKPELELTRGQLAVIWGRFLSLRLNHSFTDLPQLPNNTYYDVPSLLLYSLRVLNGTSDTQFSPNLNVTREQLASITMRTLLLGVADENDYKVYADHTAVSAWARDGISACLNNDLFHGLYDESNLQPQKPVTRAEMCKLIYNISQPAFTVTVAELTGGTITALPSLAQEGTLIKLRVTPDAGMRLKAGTLKFNDTPVTNENLTFTMPADDVLVTAEFEDAPKALESIDVTTMPTKTTYTVGEMLDLTGMVVTATYTDDTTALITTYTTTPIAGSALDTASTVTVTVSYTEGGVTKTDTFEITVSAA